MWRTVYMRAKLVLAAVLIAVGIIYFPFRMSEMSPFIEVAYVVSAIIILLSLRKDILYTGEFEEGLSENEMLEVYAERLDKADPSKKRIIPIILIATIFYPVAIMVLNTILVFMPLVWFFAAGSGGEMVTVMAIILAAIVRMADNETLIQRKVHKKFTWVAYVTKIALALWYIWVGFIIVSTHNMLIAMLMQAAYSLVILVLHRLIFYLQDKYVNWANRHAGRMS